MKGRAVGDLGSEGNCTETVKPDTLVLADGVTEYDISGLEDDKVASLVSVPLDSGPSGEKKARCLTSGILLGGHCRDWSRSRGNS